MTATAFWKSKTRARTLIALRILMNARDSDSDSLSSPFQPRRKDLALMIKMQGGNGSVT
jgi:hypothetical protein